MKTILLTLSIALLPLTIAAQNNHKPHEALADYDFIVGKIKNDYPGYAVKATPELHAMEMEYRAVIARHPDSAHMYIDKYIAFFKDKHLRLDNISTPTRLIGTPGSSFGTKVNVDTEKLSDASVKTGTLEGIWNSYNGDVAIIAREEPKRYLIVAADYREVEKGEVLYDLSPRDSLTFSVVEHVFYEGIEPRRRTASLELNSSVLEIHGKKEYFVRKSGSPVYDKSFIYAYIQRRPARNGSEVY